MIIFQFLRPVIWVFLVRARRGALLTGRRSDQKTAYKQPPTASRPERGRQLAKLSFLFSTGFLLLTSWRPVIFAETWRYLSVWRRAVPSMWRVSGEKASWPTQYKGLYQQSRGLYILWWGGSPKQHGGKKYMSFTFTIRPTKKSIWALNWCYD